MLQPLHLLPQWIPNGTMESSRYVAMHMFWEHMGIQMVASYIKGIKMVYIQQQAQ